MQVDVTEVLNEYRDHTKNQTDDLLMHKAALKSLEKQVASLTNKVAELEAENERLRAES